MRGLRLFGVIVLGLLALSSVSGAAELPSPAEAPPASDPGLDLDLSPPTIPLACSSTWYPPRGKAFWDPSVSPSCLWTCNSGTTGCANAGTSAACKSACKAACGAATPCTVLL